MMKKSILMAFVLVAPMYACEIILKNDRNEDHKIVYYDSDLDQKVELMVPAGSTKRFGKPHYRANITVYDLDDKGKCEKVLKIKQISCGGNKDPKEISLVKAFNDQLSSVLFKVKTFRCEDEIPAEGASRANASRATGSEHSSCGCSGHK